MKLTPPQIISELREKLQFNIGRHLYAVVGTFNQLERFEVVDLIHATAPNGTIFPPAESINRLLLARIGDEDLRQLVRDEARRPNAVKNRLSNELDNLLGELVAQSPLLFLKQFELLFAHNLDLSVFRTRASNNNHILLLLPGEKRGEQIVLFHEADQRFHRILPGNLIADNHFWEIVDG